MYAMEGAPLAPRPRSRRLLGDAVLQNQPPISGYPITNLRSPGARVLRKLPFERGRHNW